MSYRSVIFPRRHGAGARVKSEREIIERYRAGWYLGRLAGQHAAAPLPRCEHDSTGRDAAETAVYAALLYLMDYESLDPGDHPDALRRLFGGWTHSADRPAARRGGKAPARLH